MNKFTTLLGILISIGLVAYAIISGGDPGAYVDVPSIAIVVGGTVGSTLMVFSFSKLKSLFKILKIAFFRTDLDKVEELYQILTLSNSARKNGGLLGIASEIEAIEDPYLKKGFTLIADNMNPTDVQNIMMKEIDVTAQRHQSGQDILSFMADSAPAFGMIGTLVGLVAMLGSLDDPSQIGPKMAVALLTTLYGAMLANMIFIPLSTKLSKISDEEILIKEGLLDGLLAFQEGAQTMVIEEKLKSYLSTPLKNSLEERKKMG